MPAHPAQRFYSRSAFFFACLLCRTFAPRSHQLALFLFDRSACKRWLLDWPMAQSKITMHLSFAWWLRPYLRVLAICCVLAGSMPDHEKLEAKVKRAMRITVR